MNARLIHRVQPHYPEEARHAHLQGTVRLHAVIGRDGLIRNLQVIDGHCLLAEAAMNAVQQWRYTPTLLEGKPLEVETTITVIFNLGP